MKSFFQFLNPHFEMKSRRSCPQSRKIKLRRKVKRRSGEQAANLPEEVVMKEILPRLPVKSLLKFRCVSKSWCSLIGSKSFVKEHLNNSIRMSSLAQHLVFYHEHEGRIKQCSLPSLFDNPDPIPCCSLADLGIYLKSEISFESGSCNGLFCILENHEDIILWNPATKKFKQLPLLLDAIQVAYGSIVAHGFGFDELDNDYKVFGMACQVDINDEPIRCIGTIYSLRTNSWKVIEERDVSSFDDDDEGLGVHVNGKLHWCWNRRKDHQPYIVSLDLNSHVYGVVELPSYTTGVLHSVGIIGECLSAYFHHPNRDIDIWLMKEYAVKESWDKVVTIPQYNNHSYRFKTPTPLAIGQNGEVLLIYGSTIVVYNPKTNVFRHPRTTCIDDYADYDDYDDYRYIESLGICIGSLVSVDPGTEQER